MPVNLSDLKRESASIQKLRDAIKSVNQTKKRDERFWTPAVDSEGNGTALIRFLPACAGEEVPFVKYYDHNFKGPTGRFYIQLDRTTLGEADPVTDLNSRLWNSTTDDKSPARALARKQKRNLHYLSNIYVVRDPANPENEGKVFLYRYGSKIWAKIDSASKAEFPGEVGVNPFNMWTGANLRLRMKLVGGFRNYDDSTFDAPSPLADNDAAIATIWEKTYPLLPEVSADKFLPYDQLEAKLREVIGNTADIILGTSSASVPKASSPAPSVNEMPAPWQNGKPEDAPQAPLQMDEAGTEDSEDESGEESILKMFNSL